MPTPNDVQLDGAANDRPSNRVLGVIPARLSSTRLPQKPLVPLHGRPLIEWVWLRVRSMSALSDVVVATDSPQIASVCETFGAVVEMTASDHPSGTDRVAEVAGMERYRDAEIVVNIQGDEPLVTEAHLTSAISLVSDDGWEIGTCATPVATREALNDPSVVKVVRAPSGRALYFSRAAVPHQRDGDPTDDELEGDVFLRHLGIYAYSREALRRWVALPPTRLEQIEKLEQLRPLEAGLAIGVAVVEDAEPGVDTPADAKWMEQRLTALGLGPLAPSEV